MPKGETKLPRQKVLAAIIEAGPSGLTRKELIDKFAHLVSEQAVDMHITALNRAHPPVVYKPRPGLLIDIRFKPTDFNLEIAPETASTAPALSKAEEAALASPSPAAPVVYAVENLDVEQITARPVIFDTELDDPGQVEFCIYSSGGFDMLTEQGTISLSAPVFKKLRTFFGILAEAA